jgi:hypothetical protein
VTYDGRRKKRYKGYYDDIGHQRALEHIREAEALSRELGGTDKDVKKYFFSLSPGELKKVFDDYGQKYGRLKQEYAEETFQRWKTGQVRMSGLVAGRLFNLLPPRMPLKNKYALVENLWKEYCPRSDKIILIGADANNQEIIDTIQSYLLDTVVNYDIPSPLQRRFNWLSGGDVNVKQQLLNHLFQIEKDLIVYAMNYRVPVLLKHLNEHGSIIHKMQQQIVIGKHSLELQLNTKLSGIKLLERKSLYTSKTTDYKPKWGCICFIIVVILIILARYFMK